MTFWDLSHYRPNDVVLIDVNGSIVTQEILIEHIEVYERQLIKIGRRTLGFLMCSNRVDDIAMLLACLRLGHVPLLLGADMPSSQLEALTRHYSPDWISSREESSAPLALIPSLVPPVTLHPALGLLLSTSGSTGSPRLVRLSRESLHANAVSIAEYLELSRDERAITTLPMNYSYGLSVITSHIAAGGSIVLNSDSVISRDFLHRLQDHRVTSLAGVPYTYQMLARTGFFKEVAPSLRTLTQAGGRLDDRTVRLVLDAAKAKNLCFYVMYGQTEACARISYVPPNCLSEKIGSIGIAIPGGKLRVQQDSGELIYEGPNVMLGYAESPEDLALGDELGGVLSTGDIGWVDNDGFFHISGRLKRFIKISGNRIGLDEIEQSMQVLLDSLVYVGGLDDSLIVWIESRDTAKIEAARSHLRNQFKIHHSMVKICLKDHLPLLPTGKKDYISMLSSE
jgi:acyl-CoA synthetase (AMP-forming)/AMP-acid ligase II